MATNIRYKNGNWRRKCRARFKAMGAECGICKGTLGAIDYESPSNAQHPLSFVIDEVIPVSRAMACGYDSAQDAVRDFKNLQAAHWLCNAKKSNKINFEIKTTRQAGFTVPDGEW